MKKADFKEKTVRALYWGILETLVVQASRFCIGVLLARLLFPEQFGLIGMLWVFIAVAQTFTDSGYGLALVQKREVSQGDISTIFYLNIAVGAASTGIVYLIAPWIATFYKQPVLTSLTRAMSLIIIINSFAFIHYNMLHKQMDFKTLTIASMTDSILSGLIGIAAAIQGLGVWSLVAQQISGAIIRTVSLWSMTSWRPAFIFEVESIKQMFGFGSRMLAANLIDRLFSNIYLLVIGKLFTAADLGYFTRARTFQELPTNTVSGLVARITFPLFSKMQDDPALLKKTMKKSLTFLALVNIPMMIGLAAIARPLILVMLTDKWAECIPYLELLCYYGLLHSLNLINLNLLLALGHSELYLRLEIVKKSLIVVSIAITWPWGIIGMIYGLIIFSVISYYLNSYYSGNLIDYPVTEQLRDALPYFIVSGLMGIAVYALGQLPFANHWSLLVTQTVTGCALYVLLCRVFRLTAFMELCEVVIRKIALLRAGTVG